MTVHSFIRYPGSKAKLIREIERVLPDDLLWGPLWKSGFRGTYCEPFVGAGAMASALLPGIPDKTHVWLNDKDYWMVCLWQSVYADHKSLCKLINAFTPTAESFYEFKSQDGSASIDPVEAGFRKLALHQISFSGLGSRAGGPLGGKQQENSKYTADCRWCASRLTKKIAALHSELRRFVRVDITCKDFSAPLEAIRNQAFVYLDPPYYEKGAQLYKHSMEHADHERLSEILRAARFRWALSYDDHFAIRQLYSWAKITEVQAVYTTATSKLSRRPKNQEIVITPE